MMLVLGGLGGRFEDWRLPGPARGLDLELKASVDIEDFLCRVEPELRGQTLVGYSQGARLLGELLVRAPDKVGRAVLISGSYSGGEGPARADRDEAWAQAFAHREAGVWERWNAQSVFAGRAHPFWERLHAGDESYRQAAHELRAFSKGRQSSLLPRLHFFTGPLLFLAGGADPRHQLEAERAAAQCRQAQVKILPGAAHRVPWEAPEAFRETLLSFLPAEESTGQKKS